MSEVNMDGGNLITMAKKLEFDQFQLFQAEEARQSSFGNRARAVAAGVGISLMALAGCSHDTGKIEPQTPTTELSLDVTAYSSDLAAQEGQEYCGDVKLFPSGDKYAASRPDVLVDPRYLFRSPKDVLKTETEFKDFYVGDDGVLPNSAAVLGTALRITQQLQGEGQAGVFADQADVKAIIDLIDQNPEAAKYAYNIVCSAFTGLSINKNPIIGTYFLVVRQEGPDGKVYSALKKIDDVNFDPNTVWRLAGGKITDDSLERQGDPDNEWLLDPATGQWYLKKNPGLPEAEGTPETTTTTTSPTGDQNMTNGGDSGNEGNKANPSKPGGKRPTSGNPTLPGGQTPTSGGGTGGGGNGGGTGGGPGTTPGSTSPSTTVKPSPTTTRPSPTTTAPCPDGTERGVNGACKPIAPATTSPPPPPEY